jgi:16S rRNA (cytidine1402-2'-O)-methyltransferase
MTGIGAGDEASDGRSDEAPVTEVAMEDSAPAPAGALVVIGTPIGNLGDLSPRAVDALASADTVYCEDTRHSRKLLTHAGISGVPLRSLHEHNEGDRVDDVVAAVAAGRTVALVTDAGMPAVSDPGARVVAAVAGAGLLVTVVPGPSAVLVALVASGLATERFCFEGFLPRAGRARAERLAAVAAETRTTVLFEAPVRTAATLADLAGACGGDRPVAVARELTKLHEEVWRGTLSAATGWAADGVRGEVVLVLAGAPGPGVDDADVDDAVLLAALAEQTAAGARTRGAVDRVAADHGVSRRRVYGLAVQAKHGDPVDGPGPGRAGRE